MTKYNLKLSILITFFLIPFMCRGQMNSGNGYLLPVKGTIRIFIVFAEVDYSTCNNQISEPNITQDWPVGQLPNWKNDLFDSQLGTNQTPKQGSITDYYYQHSYGNFIVLGDYYPNLISVPCSEAQQDYISNTFTKGGFNTIRNHLNALNTPIISQHGYNLNDFDLYSLYDYQNNQYHEGTSKPNNPNGLIDAIIVIWRSSFWAKNPSSCDGGLGLQKSNSIWGAPNTLNIQNINTNTNFKTGVELISTIHACTKSNAINTILVEFFHAIEGGNNWHSGGGAGTYSSMIPVGPWCSNSQYNTMALSQCAWDRERFNWNNPTKNLNISSIDANTLQEINTDITIQNTPLGGEYVIRDFIKTGDAIKIKLPHLNYLNSGDKKNQYLWIENHQNISNWDLGMMQTYPCMDSLGNGIYAYIQIGKDIITGKSVNENIFDNLQPEYPNALGSWFFPLSAEGNWDFKYREDLAFDGTSNYATTPCLWPNKSIPTEKSTSLKNPFTGFNDMFNTYDWDHDGLLFSQGDTYGTEFGTVLNNQVSYNLLGKGDSKDVFKKSTNSKISIGANPSSSPIYTYQSSSTPLRFQNNYPANINSFENREILLNNLSVEILDEDFFKNGTNAIKIKLKWDDPNIENDQRWCGTIILKNDINDPLNRPTKLIIKENKILSVDRGFSPTQHLKTNGSFSQPSTLTMKSNTVTELKVNSQLQIISDSRLILDTSSNLILDTLATLLISSKKVKSTFKSGSNILLKENAKIIINDSSILELNEGCNLTLLDNASIIIEPGSKLVLGNGVVALIGNNSHIYIKGELEIPSGVTMHLSGLGYYQFGTENKLTFGNGSKIDLNALSPNHIFWKIDNMTNVDIHSIPIKLKSGKIQYGSSSKIQLSSNSFNIDQVSSFTIGANNINPISAFDCFNISNGLIENCHFNNFAMALNIHDNPINCVNKPNLLIKSTTFGNNIQDLVCSNLENTSVTVQSCTFGPYNQGSIQSLNALKLTNCNEIEINNTTITGKINNAIEADGINQLKIYDGNIYNNEQDGILASNSNVYVRFGALIYGNNNNGIEITNNGNQSFPSTLTVGDFGCASIFNNGNWGIKGEDFFLFMDAYDFSLQYAPHVINPNSIFNNTSGSIKIDYSFGFWNNPSNQTTLSKFSISNNYWGGGPSNSQITFAPQNCCLGVTPSFITGQYPAESPTMNMIPNNCSFQPNPEDPIGYSPSLLSARMSNTLIDIPSALENPDLADLEPASKVYLYVYRKMLDDNLDGASIALAQYLGEAEPAFNPDSKFQVTKAMGAILAHQLYLLDPCTDNNWNPSAYRTVKQNNIKDNIHLNTTKSSIVFLDVYPNPAKNSVAIRISDPNSGPYTLTVTDELGQIVLSQNNFMAKEILLNTSNLNAGIYTIYLKSSHEILKNKIVISNQ